MKAINYLDGYKTGHREQYPEGTNLVYSNFTPRADKHANGTDKEGVVVFGIQYAIKNYIVKKFKDEFFDVPKEKAVEDMRLTISKYLFKETVETKHIAELHDLGYLPVTIKALPEGSLCPIGVPLLTVVNEGDSFFWVTNFLETLLSTSLWHPITTATTARLYRKEMTKWAVKTGSPIDFIDFQGHDFSFRGLPGVECAAASGAAHLTSFKGTDTVPAIDWLQKYYNADINKELIGCSVPATEHSVMCMGGEDDEIGTFKRLITEIYPDGSVSIVSDTWDFWKVVSEYLPALKKEIMARNGKVTIRPDSGDPADIICGEAYLRLTAREEQEIADDFEAWKECVAEAMNDTFCDNLDAENPHYSETDTWKFQNKFYKVTYEPDLNRHDKTYYYVDNYGSTVSKCKFEELTQTPEQKGLVECLWETFGGTINEAGYKVLDSHIGVIYGDSITLALCKDILARLEKKGFASCNVVFGIGSYTYQYVTRDTYGFAMKATYGEVNGVGRELFKDPLTGKDKTKKSAKGLLSVSLNDKGTYELKDQCTWEEEKNSALQIVYAKGKLVQETSLSEIRERVLKSIKV